MEMIDCPLMGEKIDDRICFDIHMVVEGAAPEWTAPERAIHIKGYKNLCRQCPNHRDD